MPAVQTTPYDLASYITMNCRTICNDNGLSSAGQLLQDANANTVVLLNMAYRTFQEDLTDAGYETFTKEQILSSVGPVSNATDPAIQVSISYTGYNNGAMNFATPTLPSDMLGPLRLWERQTGSNQEYQPMLKSVDGLPSQPKNVRLGFWEWRSDQIFMIGATQANDLRLRYNVFLPELVLTPTPSQVLIVRSDRAMSYLMAKIFAEGRGAPVAASFEVSYQKYLGRLTNLSARRQQRANLRPQPYSQSTGYGRGSGGSGFR